MTAHQLTFHKKIIVRTPLYEFSKLFSGVSVTEDLVDLIKHVVNDKLFLEAIYWSSPQLYTRIAEFATKDINLVKDERLLLTLKKYLIRSCTRCTPFGLFAGCGIIGLDTIDIRNIDDVPIRKARIDMGFLNRIKMVIEADVSIRPHLRYQLNDTLYKFSDQFRYIEAIFDNSVCNYQVSSFERNSLMNKLFRHVGFNEFSFNDIIQFLIGNFKIEEINAFIENLIDSQVIVSELQLSLTSDDINRVKLVLKRIEGEICEATQYIELITAVEQVLLKLNILPLGQLPFGEINQLKYLIKKCGINLNSEHLFHIDLCKPVPLEFHISNRQVSELKEAIIALSKLTPAITPHETLLDSFKKQFCEKYGDCEISLLEAVDPEAGIGFSNVESIGDIPADIPLEYFKSPSQEVTDIIIDKKQIILQKLVESKCKDPFVEEVILTDKDLDGLEDLISELPHQISVMGQCLPSGKIFLQSVGGPNALTLLGRFSYLNEEFIQFTKTLSNEEKELNGDVVFAEVVHIPDGRSGNIARRISFYDFEINIFAKGSDKHKRINLNDLFICISGGEIIIRSKSLNKRVIPRLNNAHNFLRSSLPVYRFLASIQHQRKLGLGIQNDNLFLIKNYLPRICYNNIILRRASWYWDPKIVNEIESNSMPLLKLKEFFKRWHVSRYVCLVEGDNELFIDTANDSYLDILLDYIKKNRSLRLVEWLYLDVVNEQHSEMIRNVNQFILPLILNCVEPIVPFKGSRSSREIEFNFIPGSEWLYLKIYCSSIISDSILIDVVLPALHSLTQSGVVKEGFFIRYKDPNCHIRFRLLLSDQIVQNAYIIAFNKINDLLNRYSKNNDVWRVQIDTYQREIDRYGVKDIIKSESAFYYDSLQILSCLKNEEFRNDADLRLLFGIFNIDRWLSLFNLELSDKLLFCEGMTKSFSKEFGKKSKIQLDLKFRNLRDRILDFMLNNQFILSFEKRDVALSLLQLPIYNLKSYIHMSQNRVFTTEQRLFEYMSYFLCVKYYNYVLHNHKFG